MLIGINGILLISENIHVDAGSNPVQINLSSFAKGIMLMDIAGPSGRISSKLVY